MLLHDPIVRSSLPGQYLNCLIKSSYKLFTSIGRKMHKISNVHKFSEQRVNLTSDLWMKYFYCMNYHIRILIIACYIKFQYESLEELNVNCLAIYNIWIISLVSVCCVWLFVTRKWWMNGILVKIVRQLNWVSRENNFISVSRLIEHKHATTKMIRWN